MVKKLVVVRIEVEQDETFTFKKGDHYSYFQDPETGKWYRPKPEFTVTGENLEDLFEEV